MTDFVDGNAIGGDLFTAFGRDMTAVVGRCGNCGASSALAQLSVYVRAPGTVARCPSCGTVVMVLVRIGDRCHVHLPALALQE